MLVTMIQHKRGLTISYPEHLPFKKTVMKSENYINLMKVRLKTIFSLKLHKTINYTSLDFHLFSCFREKVNSTFSGKSSLLGEMDKVSQQVNSLQCHVPV